MLQNDALEPVIWALSWRETGFIAVRVNIILDLKYGKTFIIRCLYMYVKYLRIWIHILFFSE